MMTPYFATLEGVELTNALIERVRTFQRHLITSGFLALGFKSVRFVVGMDAKGYTSFEMKKHGPRGEYVKLKVDEYGSLYNNFMSALTGQRIVFEPQPKGEDWRASEQARRAKGVLQSGLGDGLEEALLEAVDHAVQMGHACTAVDFDPDAGQPQLPGVDGQPALMSGKMTTRAYMPQDAAFDVECRAPEEICWWILRRWVDAHELLAKFPDRADSIQRAVGGTQLEQEVEIQRLLLTPTSEGRTRTKVPLYEFRHDAMPACPDGRIAWFLNLGEPPLFADQLPFVDEEGEHRMCVRRLALGRIKGTAFGFTPLWYLVAPQEVVDMLESIEATAYRAHGVGVILNPRGSDITPKKVGTGLAVIDYTPGKEPKPMNFTTLPPDLAGAQQRKVATMQRLIGVSAIDRGDPPPNVKSGSMALFMKATSAQALQPHVNKVGKHHEGVAEDYLFLYSLFVRYPQRVTVQGELSERVEEVSGEDLGGGLKVKIDLGNPLMHTLGGRMGLADNLLAQGQIDVNGYLEFVSGVGMDRILKESDSQRILVEQENSMLRRGQSPLVSPTDNPLYHVKHHAMELNSQQARMNPAVRKAVLQHIQEHIQGWMMASLQNPGMLEALGIPVMQAALGMAGAMPPGGAPQEGGAAPDGQPMAGPADSSQMPRPPRLPAGSAAATGVNPLAPGPGGGQ